MITELRRYRIKCDDCGSSTVVEHGRVGQPDLPRGWSHRAVRGCGMTDYDRLEDLCLDCTQKEIDKNTTKNRKGKTKQ